MTERIAVLSDIHSNHLALEAVIRHARRRQVTRFWCLGDIVGRGPCPIETMLLMQHWFKKSEPVDQSGWLAGNHDYLVLNKASAIFVKPTEDELADLGGESIAAARMDEHNRSRLAPRKELWQWLDGLPTHAEPRPGIFMAHGAYLLDQATGEVNETQGYNRYVVNHKQMSDQIRGLRTKYGVEYPRLVLNGHTHLIRLAVMSQDDDLPVDLPVEFGVTVSFDQVGKQTVYVNPGSVGFPRVPNECPTYAILTLSDNQQNLNVEFHTVGYDWRRYFDGTSTTPGPANGSDFPQLFRDEIKRCKQRPTEEE